MYNYNNKDINQQEGLSDWYFNKSIQSYSSDTHPHIESRVTLILNDIWEKIKPLHSTKGNSKYHR